MDKVVQVGNIVDDTDIGFKNPQRGRIYSADGISPYLNTCGGGNLEPKILTARTICMNSKVNGKQPSLEHRVYDSEGIATAVTTGFHPSIAEPQVMTPKRTEFGKQVRKDYESGNLSMSRHDMTTMEPRTDGVSNTLTSVQKDNYLCIPEATKKGYAEAYEGDSVNIGFPSSKTRRGKVGHQMCNTLDTGCQQGVVVPINPDGECSRTIKAQYANSSRANFCRQDALGATGVADSRYRIRKLTPRECFRLMGVDDADIDKIQAAGISNSQQYKMAGNSIVVDNLYHIFRTMFVDKPTKQVKQLTLF